MSAATTRSVAGIDMDLSCMDLIMTRLRGVKCIGRSRAGSLNGASILTYLIQICILDERAHWPKSLRGGGLTYESKVIPATRANNSPLAEASAEQIMPGDVVARERVPHGGGPNRDTAGIRGQASICDNYMTDLAQSIRPLCMH